MAFLIDDIFFFCNPIWIAEKLRDMALEELEDTPEKLKRELLDLQMSFEMEKIREEEYKKKEDEILERLNALKEQKNI